MWRHKRDSAEAFSPFHSKAWSIVYLCGMVVLHGAGMVLFDVGLDGGMFYMRVTARLVVAVGSSSVFRDDSHIAHPFYLTNNRADANSHSVDQPTLDCCVLAFLVNTRLCSLSKI